MRYRSLSILLLGALAACDSDPVAPEPPALVSASEIPTASAPIQDALDRIVPTLENQPGGEGLRTALEKVDGTALERILTRLDADPANSPDVSVIRLAVASR